MKGEHSGYREKLAKQVQQVPKEKRREILDQAKSKEEYWQAKSERAKGIQEEEPIDEGLGVFIKNKTLYHGSATEGIKQFNEAEEHTVGSGIYFTSEAKDAISYARIRVHAKEQPVIYEASVENVKMIDLRKTENARKIMNGFKTKLEQWFQTQSPEKLRLGEIHYQVIQNSVQKAIRIIEEERYNAGNLRNVIFNPRGGANFGEIFSDYVKSLGYDGLITFEGGEGKGFEHDTYVIFDPEKAKIQQEHRIM